MISAGSFWFWSKPSDTRCVCDQNADFCCLLAQPASLGNKTHKKIPLEMVSDQTNMRLNPPVIRPFPSWSNLWSYHPQTEVTSDHNIPRPKWRLIIPSPDRSNLWSYYCALEPNPRPCNFGLGTHRVRWT